MTRPTLRTERLVLRPFRMEDAAAVQRLAGDPQVALTTQNIPHPYEDGMAETWIAGHEGEWEERSFLTLAVTREDEGVVGAVGLHLDDTHRRGELGYWIGRPYWNRGYATEAAAALVAFGFRKLALNRIQARYLTRNPSSARVMEKLGMRLEGVHREHIRVRGRLEDVGVYAVLASDGNGSPDTLRLYGELAPWWPLVSAPADSEEEADLYALLMAQALGAPPGSLLELGSGGGNTASWLAHRIPSVTLVDRSPAMLEVSRSLNPGCTHVEGDMRTVRLERTFDAVLLHDAVCYATSAEELEAAMETARVHCRPGGVALFVPDYVRETFRPSTDHGGHDAGARGLRYLEWTRDPDPSDTTYRVDYAFLLREGDRVSVLHDRHREGLFPRSEWLRRLRKVGFDPRVHSHRFAGTAHESVVFVAVRAR